ncbi:WhiB family transcriptional regulator [Streptomyces misionensis]|uniref:WhiB family transcriptional regulator n=1 Tax=Streptomyces misionensis TaxID=67331 RepID=UPI003675714C
MALYDPERRYLKHAICTDPADRKLFFAKTSSVRRKPSDKTQRAWDQAKEICNMCPVKMQCQRDTLGETEGVWGGRDPFQRWKIRSALSGAVRRWPRERRLKWGQELYRLRQNNTVFREIQRMTGVPEVPAMYLIREWERHLKEVAEQAPAEVVELKPAQPESAAIAKPPFPEADGRRHLWARSNGRVQDCWYRGQTEDGLWIYVLIDGRGRRYSSYKWISVDDVRIYRPQAVTVMEYVNRPDREAA